jgi:hypothetical protein
VVVAAGAVPLAACDDVLRGGSTPGAGHDPAVDPDDALLDEAVEAERQALAVLQPLVGAAPAGLRAPLVGTLRVHRAHLDLLDDSGRDVEPRPAVRGDEARRRIRRVTSIEQDLARRHAALAVRASSGQFARVLASMAAAAAQQSDLWRERGGAGG